MPLYVLGAAGMARRTAQVFEPAFRPWLYIAALGALLLFAALASLFVQLWVSIRQRRENRVFAGDPWDARGLEWLSCAPPPEYNFAVLPEVHGRDPFFDGKRNGDAYAAPASYEDIELPRNSKTGAVIGIAGAAVAFALVWYIWWLAIIGTLTIIGAVIARSFARDTTRIVSGDEVAQIERRWHRAIAQATAIPRELEMTSANQGLAKVPQ